MPSYASAWECTRHPLALPRMHRAAYRGLLQIQHDVTCERAFARRFRAAVASSFPAVAPAAEAAPGELPEPMPRVSPPSDNPIPASSACSSVISSKPRAGRSESTAPVAPGAAATRRSDVWQRWRAALVALVFAAAAVPLFALLHACERVARCAWYLVNAPALAAGSARGVGAADSQLRQVHGDFNESPPLSSPRKAAKSLKHAVLTELRRDWRSWMVLRHVTWFVAAAVLLLPVCAAFHSQRQINSAFVSFVSVHYSGLVLVPFAALLHGWRKAVAFLTLAAAAVSILGCGSLCAVQFERVFAIASTGGTRFFAAGLCTVYWLAVTAEGC